MSTLDANDTNFHGGDAPVSTFVTTNAVVTTDPAAKVRDVLSAYAT